MDIKINLFEGPDVNGTQGGLVGVLNIQPSVIMLTFTVGPGPHADNLCGARPPC